MPLALCMAPAGVGACPEEGPAVIFSYVCPTAFGYAGILFQDEPFLVKRIFLPEPDPVAAGGLVHVPGAAGPGDVSAIFEICSDIRAYFEGNSIKTPWELLDMGRFTLLQRAVLRAASSVPYGEVRSYGKLAAMIGRPRAGRFVGTTLARNPFPVLIPCHRIVRADGSDGGFSGGTDLKKRMLLLEKRITQGG